MANITINNSIDNTIATIERDINEISKILNNMYKAMLTLDETKWNTKEKKKIDEDFMPYLEKVSLKYPLYLKERLVLTKKAIKKYRNANIELMKESQKLEDFSKGG